MANLIGAEGDGLDFTYEWFRYERLMIAARCCGAAERLIEEAKLLALTGNHPENPTLSLPSRIVLGSGQKKIAVFGPFPEIEDELIAPHRDFGIKITLEPREQGGPEPVGQRKPFVVSRDGVCKLGELSLDIADVFISQGRLSAHLGVKSFVD